MPKTYRVAIVGRTGRGNYGHNHDMAWKTHPRAEIAAVADENREGLQKAAERLAVKDTFSDWREMLRKTKPEVLVIAMRWVDCHEEMVLAAAEAGAHSFLEKPMARTLEECDRMIDASNRTHVRMAVAHNMRCCPILDHVQSRLAAGVIGDLLEIRARGKEDRRSGGEDMMVLGTHMFDNLRRFAGDPLWAVGRVMVGGREITRADVNENGPEGMGAIAGDTIEGMFGFSKGVTGYFASKKTADLAGQRWGMDLVGTAGSMRIFVGHVPEVWISNALPGKDPLWRKMEIPAGIGPKDERSANHLLIDDLLTGIEEKREPQAGALMGRWAVEMAHSLYASQRMGGRVKFPLAKRTHPLL
ncbi:MAG: Gfo/Idh/MocA family oxidoreductase [Acidobacteria bacterium]|nr:Gfo/Idh/MocA family oxidoreductase [Acidobacteriota bacterium]